MTTPKSPTPESTPNLSLPDDLLVSYFACVSRLYYPTLSLVSKSYRSLLAKPELYKTRSLLNRTESCLYVYLDFSPDPKRRWYTLCKKRTQTLTKKSCGYVLAPVPITGSSFESSLVAVGSNIYAFGGNEPSSNVSILDCRSHTWHEAPRMQVARQYPAANVLDGKIYVAGGFKDLNSSNWMEVFDTKTQTWEHVLSPLAERCSSNIFNSVVLDGEIYMFGNKGVFSYKPKEDRWEAVGEHQNINLGSSPPSYKCVIDNVIYCFLCYSKILAYDPKIGYWMILKGLEELPPFSHHAYVKLLDYGGKIAVLWDKYLPSIDSKSKTIWCAVISLERRNTEEIWGKLEWVDTVLTVPNYSNNIKAFAITL